MYRGPLVTGAGLPCGKAQLQSGLAMRVACKLLLPVRISWGWTQPAGLEWGACLTQGRLCKARAAAGAARESVLGAGVGQQGSPGSRLVSRDTLIGFAAPCHNSPQQAHSTRDHV